MATLKDVREKIREDEFKTVSPEAETALDFLALAIGKMHIEALRSSDASLPDDTPLSDEAQRAFEAYCRK